MACIRFSVPENCVQHPHCNWVRSGNTLGTKRAEKAKGRCIGTETVWRESATAQAQERSESATGGPHTPRIRIPRASGAPVDARTKELGAAGKNYAPTLSTIDVHPNTLPSPKKNETRTWMEDEIRGRNAPTPVEAKVRRAELEREGGGSGGECVLWEGKKKEEKRREEDEGGEEGGRREGNKRGKEGNERKGGGDGRPAARAAHHMPHAHELQARTTEKDSPPPKPPPPKSTPNLATFPAFRIPHLRASIGNSMWGRAWVGEEDERGEGVDRDERLERGRYGKRSGSRKCVGNARSRGRTNRRRAEAGSTAQRSHTLTSSTLGIEDLDPRTKEGLGQVGEERAKAGGRMGELELLSVSL
ncbi:hypothetical protein B0H13DRAFT_1879866 [Mycena leptocephala]|nr:hypothetical protein B0H13DRAFT_1879866 [Mycena leptocephala]